VEFVLVELGCKFISNRLARIDEESQEDGVFADV